MVFLSQYNDKVVKYDLINKFHYKFTTKIPKLKFIILNFKLKKWDIKSLISALASLELITSQKAKLTTSKVSNIVLKVRKGQPVGCKITLRNRSMNKFLFKIINSIISTSISEKLSKDIFSIKIDNVLIFKELEINYQFFKNLTNLNIQIKPTNCNFNEFWFLIKSHKLFSK